MRTTTIGMLAVSLLAAGCGGTRFANRPAPPVPINLSVYIDDARVSVSPASVGAGPVVFVVTNQASRAESMVVLRAGGSVAAPLADTGPISPQATAQVSVNMAIPGTYTVATGPNGSSEAALATPSSIKPAFIQIGPRRPSGSNALLQP
jgi:hypothetical protein